MTDAAADSATTWLTELDAIEDSWNVTLFIHSRLGRLPVEMIENIIRCVPTSQLPALARTSPLLCEMVENRLYCHIIVNGVHSRSNWGHFTNVIWPLHRTLVQRPDLAKKVRTFDCTVFNEDDTIDVDASTLDLLDQRLHLVTKVSVNQMATAGCIVLQRLSNVEKVCLTLLEGNGSRFLSLTPNPMHKLRPGFDCRTAHSLHFPGLQKLKKLDFAGAEFHWALAKLPCLQSLTLSRPCLILDDEAPDEVSTSLTRLEICASTDILRSNKRAYSNFSTFLAHFPALADLKLMIYESKNDGKLKWWFSGRDKSYDTLLERLSPVASQLRSLDLGVYDEDPSDSEANDFLYEVLPAAGFLQFTVLVDLVVPFQGLLGHATSPVDPLPPPAMILPNTLKTLTVHCPEVYIYDWLARLRNVSGELPDLTKIILYSQLPYGDEFPVLWFEQREHPFKQILTDSGISFESGYRKRDWEIEWADFDVKAAEQIDWLNGLAAEST